MSDTPPAETPRPKCICCGNVCETQGAWCNYCFTKLANDSKHRCVRKPAAEPAETKAGPPERICKCGARDWGIVHQPLVDGDGWPNLIRHDFELAEPAAPVSPEQPLCTNVADAVCPNHNLPYCKKCGRCPKYENGPHAPWCEAQPVSAKPLLTAKEAAIKLANVGGIDRWAAILEEWLQSYTDRWKAEELVWRASQSLSAKKEKS